MNERSPEDAIDELRTRVGKVAPELDELRRRRILTRVHQELDEKTRFLQWRTAVLATACAVAVFALLWLRSAKAPELAVRGGPKQSVKEQVEARRDAVDSPSARPPLELVPYLVAGTEKQRAEALMDHATSLISIDASQTVRAALGTRARITLTGPAELRVLGTTSSSVELELVRGVLCGSYDHESGGRLLIRSPKAVSEIVGTVFRIEANQARSQIAVMEGRVQVRSADGTSLAQISADQSFDTQAHHLHAISSAERRELDEHTHSAGPPGREHGVLALTGSQLSASVGGSLLGRTPLWVALPLGAQAIELRDERGPRGSVQTQLRAEPNQITLSDVVGGTTIEKAHASDGLAGRAPHRPKVPSTRAHASSSFPGVPLRAQRSVTSAAGATDVATPPLESDTDDLYAEAERNMAAGRSARATILLDQLLARTPPAPNLDLALYDRATIAFQRGDFGSALSFLKRLSALAARPLLAEPSLFLQCRSLQGVGSTVGAMDCYRRLRALFHDSIHDAEALAWLAALQHQRQGCAARAALEEYVARYGNGPFAADARNRLAQCEKGAR
ncbi:MAG: Outer rane lipoprotein [Pseudomonadota bacterium]